MSRGMDRKVERPQIAECEPSHRIRNDVQVLDRIGQRLCLERRLYIHGSRLFASDAGRDRDSFASPGAPMPEMSGAG